jgi:3-deoxy-D-manno-octulosonic-acid transferase
MRQLYTLLFYTAVPLIMFRLYWRGRKAPQYRQRWQERLGYYQGKPHPETAWIHAVSVGEVEAAFPLIKLLQTRHPQRRLLITTTTPTGSARVSALLGDSVEHVYLPYDLPLVINRFFRHFRPQIAIFMEKEIWPNLFHGCAQRQIPLFIINARLSSRSSRSYRKIPSFIQPALQCLTHIACQTTDDRNNFISIGAPPALISVLGNIKFDIHINDQTIADGLNLKNQLFKERFVWLVGSTHQGEDVLFLQLYQQLKPQIPELLLVIAPRHPERFQAVNALCADHHLHTVLRSQQLPVSTADDVYLIDSIGELKMLYAAADLAFVAGSMLPTGGHNVLEPAAAGVPVLFGPHMFNFQEIALQMLANAAARQCADTTAIADTVLLLHGNLEARQQMIANARRFIGQNQGATQRIADLLEQHWQTVTDSGGERIPKLLP